jgi:signal-transduction protein with cAMP-binding, CBS, and nucleotidyltransferase domain
MSVTMVSQLDIFRQLVRDHMDAAVVTVERREPCASVVEKMGRGRASCAVVTEPGGRPAGILTEWDVARRIAFRVPEERPVSEVMTSPVATLGEDVPLYRAIAEMRRRGFRHMPVVGRTGRIVGVLHLRRALAVSAGPTLELVGRLTHERTLAGLKRTKAAQVELAAALLAENVAAPDIQSLLTEINVDLHRRIVELSLGEMAELGWGEPPVRFCVVVMGSAGRGESSIRSDQDNAFILDDCGEAERGRIEPFFVELAKRMTRALDGVGIPLCRGDVMATNPTWRKTLSGWRRQIKSWIGRRSDFNIRLADIFFDFQPACGDEALARELRDHVTRIVAANPGFLRDMYGLEADHRVALGPFGRLRTEDDHDREGKIDLKYAGTLPLVEGVRLFALKAGVAATSTRERIDRLRDRGVLSADEQDYLKGAFALVTELLLRQQLADFRAGRPVSNLVPEESLSDREKDMLVDCFRAVRRLRSRVRSELTGRIF